MERAQDIIVETNACVLNGSGPPPHTQYSSPFYSVLTALLMSMQQGCDNSLDTHIASYQDNLRCSIACLWAKEG